MADWLGLSPMDYAILWELTWIMPVRPPTAPLRAPVRAPPAEHPPGRAVPRQAVILATLAALQLWQYTKMPEGFRREYLSASLSMFAQRETVLRDTRPVAERS